MGQIDKILTVNDVKKSTAVVVPLYNHSGTITSVLEGIFPHGMLTLVVDDGSTDLNEETLIKIKTSEVIYIKHEKNMGKGAAIMTAVKELKTSFPKITHIVTMDADGQHSGSELPLFIEKIKEHPNNLIIGLRNFNTPNVGKSSKFGRSFSNFWFRLQTSRSLGDTQSGYRAYPLKIFDFIKCSETRFSFEIEVIVKASWAGFTCEDISIPVHYPPKGERISHFDFIKDNIRLSILNTRLTVSSMLPHRKVREDHYGNITLIHPLKSIRLLLADKNTPAKLAFSAALGMFLGTFPLIAVHSVAILIAAAFLDLNKYLALAVSQLCMPPIVPAIAVEAGYYIRHGEFLTEISFETLGYQFLDRLFEYILGAAFLAPFLASAAWISTYFIALIISKSLRGRNTAL